MHPTLSSSVGSLLKMLGDGQLVLLDQVGVTLRISCRPPRHARAAQGDARGWQHRARPDGMSASLIDEFERTHRRPQAATTVGAPAAADAEGDETGKPQRRTVGPTLPPEASMDTVGPSAMPPPLEPSPPPEDDDDDEGWLASLPPPTGREVAG